MTLSSPYIIKYLLLTRSPPLDTIFNIIQQEENHKKIMIARDQRSDSIMAFAAKEQAPTIEMQALWTLQS